MTKDEVMAERKRTDARILIVDDDPSIVLLLSRVLQSAGYSLVEGITDSGAVPAYLDKVTPDLVVLDICMPGIDGYALLEDIGHRLSEDTFLPILVMSGLSDCETKDRAFEAGAKDFLVKPLNMEEFLLHVSALLDTRFMNLRLNQARDILEDRVRRRTRELGEAQRETLELLGRVAEVRDDATGQHTRRVATLSGLIALELQLPTEEVELIIQTASLHDLGKVAIADAVLLKPGCFDQEERESMREHAALGAKLLHGARSKLLQMAEVIAANHHERWDGQGYPQGLSGEAIPLAARIVAVADAFDALTHVRPYKEAWSEQEALAEIERESGWQFDPRVVDALVRVQQQERALPTMGVAVPRRIAG
jgi:putative two-component system response regulator